MDGKQRAPAARHEPERSEAVLRKVGGLITVSSSNIPMIRGALVQTRLAASSFGSGSARRASCWRPWPSAALRTCGAASS
jgi:hypothetical protein